jgi:hypothetical protein
VQLGFFGVAVDYSADCTRPSAATGTVGPGLYREGMSETFNVCEACGEQVDSSDAEVVRAVPLQLLRTFGASQVAEGVPVLFHRDHFPAGSGRYRLLD